MRIGRVNSKLKFRLLRSAAALPLLLAGPALAASPAGDWSGFYAGLTAGGVWANSHETTNLPCTEPGGGGYLCIAGIAANAPVASAAGTGSLSSTGFSGGVEGGYNWQNGPAVYGIELDFESFKGASRTSSVPSNGTAGPPAGSPITIGSSVSADWLFTSRARIGYAFNDILIYGTGGLALTRLGASYTYSDASGGAGTWNTGQNRVGWTAGGGVEWAFSKAWSVKAEYLYVKFNSITASGTIFGPAFGYHNAISTSADLTAQIARAGVNYKF